MTTGGWHWRDALDRRLWAEDARPLPAGRRMLLELLRLCAATLRDVREGEFGLRAASLSYTTLLSFVPLLAVTFSVLKGLGAHDALEPFLRDFLRPLGAAGDEAAARLMEFVGHVQLSVLGSVSIALLLWGLIAMMQKIEGAFNDIWRVAVPRSLFQRVRDYLSLLLIGPTFLFLSMGMTTALHFTDFTQEYLHVDLTAAARAALYVIPYVLFICAFAALYMFMPNTRVSPLPALVASLFSAFVWKVLGSLFALFVAGSADYAAIYSAFAALVLFMIWIYAAWMTVLAGAAVCYYLQYPSNRPLSRHACRMSLRARQKLSLQICAAIGRAHYRHEPPFTAAALAAVLRLPELVVKEAAEDLVRAGLLARTAGPSPRLVPGRPFDATSVEAALRGLQAAHEAHALHFSQIPAAPGVARVMTAIDAALHRELGGITLKHIALEETEE